MTTEEIVAKSQQGQSKPAPPGFEPIRKLVKKKTTIDEKFRNLKMFFKKDKSQATTTHLSPLPKPKNQWNVNRDVDNNDVGVLTIDFVKNQYAACNNFTSLDVLRRKLTNAYDRETVQITILENEIEEVEQTLKFDKVS